MEPFDIESMLSEPQANTNESVASTAPLKAGQRMKKEAEIAEWQMGEVGETATKAEPEIEAVPKFWNQDKRKPQHVIQVERPEHRAICILAAQGFTSTEIAEQTGYTTACIQNVRKQEWAQSYIAQLMEKSGRKAVMSELQGAAREAAQLLVKSIRGELPDQKPADRCKDAHKLLDRLYGTAPQIVMHGNVDAAELSDEELAATIASGNS